jgi:hypothetical protein
VGWGVRDRIESTDGEVSWERRKEERMLVKLSGDEITQWNTVGEGMRFVREDGYYEALIKMM